MYKVRKNVLQPSKKFIENFSQEISQNSIPEKSPHVSDIKSYPDSSAQLQMNPFRVQTKLVDNPLKDVKVSYESIKFLFPQCKIQLPATFETKIKPQDIHHPKNRFSATDSQNKTGYNLDNIKQETIQTSTDKCDANDPDDISQLHSTFEDKFIEVEWDNGERTEEPATINKNLKEKQPVIVVGEILVLKPKWLQDHKKVIFRDFNVNLTNCRTKLENEDASKRNRSKFKQSKPHLHQKKQEARTNTISVSSSFANNPTGQENQYLPLPPSASAVKTRSPQHECVLCKRKFRTNSLLFRHLLVHTGEKPYKCSTCEKGFRTSTKLKIHGRIHTGERPYKCQACGGRFMRTEHLNQHAKRNCTRPKRKPFACNVCEEKFLQLYQLNIHVGLVHTGESPYKCKYCNKPFTRTSNLRRHIKDEDCPERGKVT